MTSALDVSKLKLDFPIFSKEMRNKSKLIYLDSGATSQKPKSVVDAEAKFYFNHNGAVNRGSHLLAEEASEAYENARDIVAEFIGAPSDEVIFTKSATESINLLAYSISNTKGFIGSEDEILVSEMEHHANLIPWQELAKRSGAKLRWIHVNSEGRLDLTEIDSLINSNTKILALAHQSNVLGTVNEISDLVTRVKKHGGYVFLDGCQSIPHLAINVLDLGVDAFAFSGHKMLGPTGTGVLWAKAELLDRLEPFLFGGSMIESVTMESATWAPIPRKFEAGVPNMAGVIGLGAAVNYLKNIGMSNIQNHMHELTNYALPKLSAISGLQIFGPKDAANRGPTFSFAIDGIHPHDAGQVLDQYGIAVRTGHHCAWPLMKKFGLTGTTRASFYIYNSKEDVDALVQGIIDTKKYFKVN
jgi:cysteine desulfurase/selenocysteine lyase